MASFRFLLAMYVAITFFRVFNNSGHPIVGATLATLVLAGYVHLDEQVARRGRRE